MRWPDPARSLCLIAALLAPGCTGKPAGAPAAGPDASLDADTEATREIQDALTKAITEAGHRYSPLTYSYDEDLLAKLDRIEARLSEGESAPAARFIVARPGAPPKLDEAEELAHYRETVRRWEAETGKTLRKSIDPLKAEVAARKPGGPAYHPEFHRRFAAEFDQLRKVELLEMRERRNRAVRAAAEEVFAKYRPTHPDLVRHFEAMLDTQGFALPAPAEEKTAPVKRPQP